MQAGEPCVTPGGPPVPVAAAGILSTLAWRELLQGPLFRGGSGSKLCGARIRPRSGAGGRTHESSPGNRGMIQSEAQIASCGKVL